MRTLLSLLSPVWLQRITLRASGLVRTDTQTGGQLNCPPGCLDVSTSTAHRHINVVPPLTPFGVARLLPCLAHPLPSTSSLWYAGAVAGKQLDPHSARLLGHASHVSSELQRAVPSAPRVPRGHAACTAKPRAKTAALADAGSKAAHVTLEVSAATCLSSSPALAATAFRPSSHPARIPAELCLTLLLCPSAAFYSQQLYHNFPTPCLHCVDGDGAQQQHDAAPAVHVRRKHSLPSLRHMQPQPRGSSLLLVRLHCTTFPVIGCKHKLHWACSASCDPPAFPLRMCNACLLLSIPYTIGVWCASAR